VALVVVLEAAVLSSPRWSSWSRLRWWRTLVAAELVVLAVVAVVVREAAVPSSPRWQWQCSVAVVADLVVDDRGKREKGSVTMEKTEQTTIRMTESRAGGMGGSRSARRPHALGVDRAALQR